MKILATAEEAEFDAEVREGLSKELRKLDETIARMVAVFPDEPPVPELTDLLAQLAKSLVHLKYLQRLSRETEVEIVNEAKEE